MRRAMLRIVPVALAISTEVVAQTTPDFSGTWVSDYGAPISLVQTPTTLTVARPRQVPLTYRLNGFISQGGRSREKGDNEYKLWAMWKGETLLLRTVMGGTWIETYDKLSLNSSGQLVIDNTRLAVVTSTRTYTKRP